jgi:IS5 family transposase
MHKHAAKRLHGEEKVVNDDSSHHDIKKREEQEDSLCEFRIALRPSQRRELPAAPEELWRCVWASKARLRARLEQPFLVINRQFGFEKTR